MTKSDKQRQKDGAQPEGSYPDFDLDNPKLAPAIKDRAMRSGGFPYDEKLRRKDYKEQLLSLQLELLKFQSHVEQEGLRVIALFEGRDTSGKGGCIMRFLERMNPRHARSVHFQNRPTPSGDNGIS